ncbi:hypothetical protein J6590_030251 [Homalodisca vitripennis]|nr:hypothetical protein J6590_030251 [Homalodisca vitripennis]
MNDSGHWARTATGSAGHVTIVITEFRYIRNCKGWKEEVISDNMKYFTFYTYLGDRCRVILMPVTCQDPSPSKGNHTEAAELLITTLCR